MTRTVDDVIAALQAKGSEQYLTRTVGGLVECYGVVRGDPDCAAAAAEITRLRAEVAQQAADLRTLAVAVRPIRTHALGGGQHRHVFHDDPTRDAAIAAALGRALRDSGLVSRDAAE